MNETIVINRIGAHFDAAIARAAKPKPSQIIGQAWCFECSDDVDVKRDETCIGDRAVKCYVCDDCGGEVEFEESNPCDEFCWEDFDGRR